MMKEKKHLKVIAAAVIIVAIILTGCTAKKEVSYAAFLVEKMNAISEAVTGLKNQMDGFTADRFSDEAWLNQTKTDLQQIKEALDQIIQYENVPDKMASFQESLIACCEKGKTLSADFETAIAEQNTGAMLKVNENLEALKENFQTFIQQVKEKSGSE